MRLELSNPFSQNGFHHALSCTMLRRGSHSGSVITTLLTRRLRTKHPLLRSVPLPMLPKT
jgi:hypothetical protein